MNPDWVERCIADLHRKKGACITGGPNHFWSIDGYDKLKHWGIEIYARINAYLRFILWICVGYSNCINISPLCQYLKTVRELGYKPEITRSD